MSATFRGAKRIASDLYKTPLEAFRPMLPYLKLLPGPIWEPAAGDWRLVREISSYGIQSAGTDINGSNVLQLDGRDSFTRLDFLEPDAELVAQAFPTICTNPPFSLAFEFCQRAVSLCPNVVLLLRLNFLAGQKRQEWFRANKPSALFILSKRPSFTGKGTDATDYAWVYWGKELQGLYWI